MNNVLSLTGQNFIQRKRGKGFADLSLPVNSIVKLSDLTCVLNDLENVEAFWDKKTIIPGVLLEVHYNRIVAKSNRITKLLKVIGKKTPNDMIVGAKFNDEKTKHIITYYISKDCLKDSISNLKNVIKIFKNSFPNGQITKAEFDNKDTFKNLEYGEISASLFKGIIRDICFINFINVKTEKNLANDSLIVTFYETDISAKDICSNLGVNISDEQVLNRNTIFLDEQYVQIITDKVPFLISMAVEDFTELAPENVMNASESALGYIESPKVEPTIGVLDTLFDDRVYFSEWVEYHDEISDEISKDQIDYRHGTAVTSLIVDAPSLNPWLQDNCGHFKVRHFGVSLARGYNSFSLIKKIRQIVETNTDIKVWNLSLGSEDEVRANFISAQGAVLDKLQYDFDVIFVIAGTNLSRGQSVHTKIGAPADSLNSLVVNSVDRNGNPANYTRDGIVLSFFLKPDVSYYGGVEGDLINVVEPLGMQRISGTSFAAPLIARKLAYLIEIIGLSREAAKALIIDSAIGWETEKLPEEVMQKGNGVVPIDINDVLKTPDDEIKYIVTGVSEKYNSYLYKFPVPIKNNKFPYIAKATLVYFPNTNRNQGVDYTNTDLNLKFGRLKGEIIGDHDPIDSINKDKQNLDDGEIHYLKESQARTEFRKWDNVKHLTEKFTGKQRPKKIYNKDLPDWGMSIKTNERLTPNDGKDIKFGVVVTLKALDGENRIDEFIQTATLRAWIVNELEIENRVKVYVKENEEIEFE